MKRASLVIITLLLIASLMAVASTVSAKGPDKAASTTAMSGPTKASNNSNSGGNKVTICRVPYGNPAAAHEISVSVNAMVLHLSHGDELGICNWDDGDPGGGWTPGG